MLEYSIFASNFYCPHKQLNCILTGSISSSLKEKHSSSQLSLLLIPCRRTHQYMCRTDRASPLYRFSQRTMNTFSQPSTRYSAPSPSSLRKHLQNDTRLSWDGPRGRILRWKAFRLLQLGRTLNSETVLPWRRGAVGYQDCA